MAKLVDSNNSLQVQQGNEMAALRSEVGGLTSLVTELLKVIKTMPMQAMPDAAVKKVQALIQLNH